ncbi:hypothetical protein DQ244_17430 [Blastococcus sp. TBT05-19]|uniref:hypothetical protein n=1 Tax=Blastococcus sp. TBT05-19 TaxID=2250581 RepID=UPI000DEB06D8|nr:hypothetical protein [Blastococcus sp. TBT05-19]RBY87120.1 hypothetical protein DQ244_17430 [Blastococcus sp. TBT05-19]
MDVLRRRSGARRSSRWWDRWQWFALLTVALVCVALGGAALVDQLRSRPDGGEVIGCRTERPADRLPGAVTTCEVATADGAVELQTARRHPAGSELALRRTASSVFDPDHNEDELWWLAAGAVIALATWWAGLPPRSDLTYGRHAAARNPRRSSRVRPSRAHGDAG